MFDCDVVFCGSWRLTMALVEFRVSDGYIGKLKCLKNLCVQVTIGASVRLRVLIICGSKIYKQPVLSLVFYVYVHPLS